MARAIQYSKGGLTKRKTKSGWKWSGQVKWRYVGESKWRTKEKVLTDTAGRHIAADERNIDPDTKKDRNKRNIRTANAAYELWYGSLDTIERNDSILVGDYLASHVETLKRQADAARVNRHKGMHTASTLRGYREYIPIISDGFEGIRLADLDSRDVYRWIEGMKERGMAASTMRKAFSILSKACARAVKDGDLTANPCTQEYRDEIPRAPLAEPNALAPAEIERTNTLLDEAKNPRLRVGARLALTCGLRAGEVCALRWRDIDVPNWQIHVRESISNAGGGTVASTPKSKAGTRSVPLPHALASELMAWRESQCADWQRVADGQADDATPFDDCRVIGYADGSWFTPNSLGHLWNKLAKGKHERDRDDRRKAGTGYVVGHEPVMGMTGEQIRLHDLRHTYATYHIATGTDVARTATLMGHADAAVTMRRYTGRIKDQGIMDAIKDKSADEVLSSGTMWTTDGVFVSSPGDDVPTPGVPTSTIDT